MGSLSAAHEPAAGVGVEPIAIIGMACRLPGSINNPSSLWETLLAKRNTQTPVPPSRFTHSSFHHPDGSRLGSLNIPGGNFIDQISAFDASFFGVSPVEAHSMDPQQRLLLEVAFECLESAGILAERLRGMPVGMYVGAWTADYENIQLKDPESKEAGEGYSSWITGTGRAILSNRVSYLMDLRGPSMTIDTGCSSTAMALHIACQALREPASCTHSALVGGTNLMINPEMPISMTTLGILSPTGGCATFDERADGYSRADGINCLYLKRLSDALKDGDPIRAVIRGSALNSDGKTMGLAAPSAVSQEVAIREAYASAAITDFTHTAYFECHGTGTVAGDPMEALALAKVFGRARDIEDPLYVGAVKSNLGHSEAASAITSVMKAVLAVEAGQIPPNVGFEKPNSKIKFDAWKIKVPTEVVPWPKDKPVKRASVSSYGYGGANAHFVVDDIESYLNSSLTLHPAVREAALSRKGFLHKCQRIETPRSAKRPYLIPFSAKTEGSIKQYVQALADSIVAGEDAQNGKLNLADLAYTLGVRRSLLPMKAFGVLSGETSTEISEELKAMSDLECVPEAMEDRRLGFVFTGQGAQWAGMGVELIAAFPVVERTLGELNSNLKNLEMAPEWDLLEELKKPKETSRINEPELSQVLCTAIQICIVRLLQSWNILPRAVVGHSSGEIAAAYASGSLTAAQAIAVSYYRGLICSLAIDAPEFPKGGMLAVGLSELSVGEFLVGEQFKGRVGVACVNSPNSVTISGDLEAIDLLEEKLKAAGSGSEAIFFRRLKVPLAYHSHHMGLLGPEYQSQLQVGGIVPKVGCCPFYSSVTGEMLDGRRLGAAYWRQNLESTVLFSDAVKSMVVDGASVNTLIEIGPHSALASPLRDVRSEIGLSPEGLMYIPSLIRGKDGSRSILEVAGKLFSHGFTALDMEKVNGVEGSVDEATGEITYEARKVLVDLPGYMWDHSQEYWLECRRSKEWRFRKHPRHDILGSRLPGIDPCEPQWMNVLSVSNAPWIKDHIVRGNIIFPASGYICMAVEALTQFLESIEKFNPEHGFLLREVTIQKPLILPEGGPMNVGGAKGTEVFLTLRAEQTNIMDESRWYRFNIRTIGSGNETVKHCSGLISMEKRKAGCKGPPEISASGPFVRELNDKRFYEIWNGAGYNYGPSFAGLKNFHARTDRPEMWGEMLDFIKKDKKSTVRRDQKEHEESVPTASNTEETEGELHEGSLSISSGAATPTSSTLGGSGLAQSAITSITSPDSNSEATDKDTERQLAPRDLDPELAEKLIPPQSADIDMLRRLHMKNAKDHIDSRYAIHPVNLDIALQLYFATLHSGRLSSITDILVPVFIEEMYLATPSPETTQFNVHSLAEFLPCLLQTMNNTVAYDASGQEVIRVKNIQGLEVGQVLRNQKGVRDPDIMRLNWVVDYDVLNQDNYRQAMDINAPQEALKAVPTQDMTYLLNLMTADIINVTVDLTPTKPHLQKYRGWLVDRWEKQKNISTLPSDPTVRKEEIERLVSERGLIGELVHAAYTNIRALFRGEVDATDVLERNDLWARFNALEEVVDSVKKLASLYSNKYSKANILEIGAGTGGSTQAYLNGCTKNPGSAVMEKMYQSYTFTDINPGLITRGREKFEMGYAGMMFGTLNIEDDPAAQGFEQNYDIVHAVNVLHNTKNLTESLKNIGKLLRPGGRVHITDFIAHDSEELDYIPFALGTLESWWRAEEEHRSRTPLISLQQWINTLESTGFRVDFTVSGAVRLTGCASLAVTYIGEPTPIAPTLRAPPTTRRIILLHRRGLRAAWEQFQESLVSSFATHEIIPIDFESTPFEIPSSASFVLSLLELDKPLLAGINSAEFEKFKQLTSLPVPVLWVTTGVHLAPTNPKGALINGFARTLRNETATTNFNVLDLSTQSQTEMAAHISSLVKSIMSRELENPQASDATGETLPDWEYCEYMGLRFVPRLILDNEVKARYAPQKDHQTRMEPYRQNTKNLGLVCSQRGLLSSLVFEDRGLWKRLPADHVEIEPDVFGLNFEDVATAMGIIPFATVGKECSGIVRRVGSDVKNLAVGDRVFTLSPNEFSNRFSFPAAVCSKIPENADPVEFTGSLVVYATVVRALVHVARMEKGEKILIHSAAGGVGNAAIQLSKYIGAEIFATCGSAEKRRFLTETHGIPPDHIFSSRDTSFRQDLMAATGGEGVDVILNSLAGELLHESWKCLAPCGRFIEIGKRDMLLSGKLDMTGFMKNTVYAAVDLAGIFTGGSKLIGKLLKDLMRMYTEGVIKPISPITRFPITEVEQAFSFMSTGAHIGKIVLTVDTDPAAEQMVKVVQRPHAVRFDTEATYLLIGGLGGIGCSLAVWMAEKGAKHLTFMSRSGVQTEEAKYAMKDIAALGCAVQVLQCDVGDAEAVETALATVTRPLRGVVHAAMVLKDGIFENMQHADFVLPLHSKVNGLLNLERSLNQPRYSELDFFVVLSSISGVLGTPGQSNYAAAGAFEDAFVRSRQRQGKPASVLDLGVISGIGYVSQNSDVERKLQQTGIGSCNEIQLQALFHMALETPLSNSGSGSPQDFAGAQLVTGIDIHTLDLGKARDGTNSWFKDPKWRVIDSTASGLNSSNGAGAVDEEDINAMMLEKLKGAETKPTDDVIADIAEYIIRKTASMTMIPAAEILPEHPLSRYGMDSLVAVEMRNWLLKVTSVELKVSDIMTAVSIKNLAEKIYNVYRAKSEKGKE